MAKIQAPCGKENAVFKYLGHCYLNLLIEIYIYSPKCQA